MAQPVKEAASKSAAYNYVANNAFKTRKVWPPNFKELNPQQQLRFEKKYKRRVYLAHHSEKWDKGVRIFRFAMVSGSCCRA